MEYIITDKVVLEATKYLDYSEGDIDAKIRKAIERIIEALNNEDEKLYVIDNLEGVEVKKTCIYELYPFSFLEMLPFGSVSEINLAKQTLKDAGYFVDNLWCTEDVTFNFNCTEEEAMDILNEALEENTESINISIDKIASNEFEKVEH